MRDIMTTASLVKENIQLGWLTYSSEAQSLITVAGNDGIQADMVLEK